MMASVKRFLISILDFLRYKKSYAQDGEDVVLLSLYQNQKHHRGFFVDVGAHHPVRFSNTWALYKNGWRGINIDPTPGSMRPFRWLRRRDINLEIGVGPQAGQMTFHCFNEPALNTFDPELAQQRNSGQRYFITQKIAVQIAPLGVILDQHLPPGQTIDVLTIDVEGLDFSVLQSNNWEKYRPEIILVEDTRFRLDAPNDSEIYRFLTGQGYEIVALLQRTIFYRRRPGHA
jgi:FkbM family methyltransferase